MKNLMLKMVMIGFFFSTIFSIHGQTNAVKKEVVMAKAMLMDVSLKSDSIGLFIIQDRLSKLLENKAVAPLAHYYTAFAKWQLSFITSDQEAMKALLNEAISHLNTATELDSNFADAYGLAWMCYSPFFRLEPQRSYELAQKSNPLLQKALALAPENPRVILFDAMSIFYKPEQYGGSQEKGMERFLKATQLSESSPVEDSIYPDWGKAIGYSWMGWAYLNHKQPNPQKAKTAFEKSLSFRPDFAFVKLNAIPTVEAQLNGKD